MSMLTASRVVFVSGKGGVGKTTVAASIAVAAARSGRHVLLAELEDRVAFAPIFGKARLAYTEQPLAPNITGLSVEADEALVEYLQMFYGIPRISRALVKSRAVEFATTTAPGLKDILLIGKIKEAEGRRQQGAHVFDLIVVDAPPTGRLPRFLEAPRSVSELARGGPIRTQAQSVIDMVMDPKRSQVVLVAVPEEMPARETAEAAELLKKMGVALGPVIVNQVYPMIEGLGRSPVKTLRTQAAAAGIEVPEESIAALADVAAPHARRARTQREVISQITDETGQRVFELPFLFTERIGRAEIDALGTILEAAL